MSFENLGLVEPILKSIKKEGYLEPTPIQTEAIPHILANKDLLASAQTGTGKTATFAMPIIQLLSKEDNGNKRKKNIKALVLTPTRELAIQVDESIRTYGKFSNIKTTVVFGGVNQYSQVNSLKRGVDVLIATPGRLLDLVKQGHVNLSQLQMFVLDEVDRMLDMGFINDINKLIDIIPKERQCLFFSATLPTEIVKLANNILNDPVKIVIKPVEKTLNLINQVVYFVDRENKTNLLMDILDDKSIKNVLIFTRTKYGADKLVKHLNKEDIKAKAIHGNKSQMARQNALKSFKEKKTRVLVATDIASRGIDVDDLAYVINYEISNEIETYVHRIGRTGRAGSEGLAISFCDSEEKYYLADIEQLIKKKITVVDGHNYPMMNHYAPKPKKRNQRSNRGNSQFNNSRSNTNKKKSYPSKGKSKRFAN